MATVLNNEEIEYFHPRGKFCGQHCTWLRAPSSTMPPHTCSALYTLPCYRFLKTHHARFYLKTFAHAALAAGKTFPLVLPMVGSWSFRVRVRCHLLREAFLLHQQPSKGALCSSHCLPLYPVLLSSCLFSSSHIILFMNMLVLLSVSALDCNNMRPETLFVLFMTKFPALRMQLSSE